MALETWIQFAALLIALVTLAVNQYRMFDLERAKETRFELKMRIFHILVESEQGHKAGKVVEKLQKSRPAEPVDAWEVHKALYEMFVEDTLDFGDDKRWSVAVSVDDE